MQSGESKSVHNLLTFIADNKDGGDNMQREHYHMCELPEKVRNTIRGRMCCRLR